MADGQNGTVPLTGKAVYDQELYGGSDRSGYAAVVGEDEDLDEREKVVAR